MRVALYARVSSESQQARGTIGSQLEVLRARIAGEGHELVAEFCDDGFSGARLDRPGLDAMRDQAEAGVFEAVWCLSPDRLARAYVYQVLVLDELAQLGVRVVFADAPGSTRCATKPKPGCSRRCGACRPTVSPVPTCTRSSCLTSSPSSGCGSSSPMPRARRDARPSRSRGVRGGVVLVARPSRPCLRVPGPRA